MSERHHLGDVDAFTAGAVGRPGQRTFFLQARVGRTAVSVKCEKQQVAALAQYLQGMLDDLPTPTDQPVPSALELAEPLEAAFVLGAIAVGVDQRADRIVLQLNEMALVDDESDDETDEADEVDEPALVDDEEHGAVTVSLTRGQAGAFCRHAEAVVSAGRPTCRWCGRPIDPDGHPCARMN
jgi:uncharacterized repeat protein (TIGR03847 family)